MRSARRIIHDIFLPRNHKRRLKLCANTIQQLRMKKVVKIGKFIAIRTCKNRINLCRQMVTRNQNDQQIINRKCLDTNCKKENRQITEKTRKPEIKIVGLDTFVRSQLPKKQLKPGSIPTIFVFSKATSSRRVLDRCLPTTSTERYAASTSTEANVGMEKAEILTTKEKESSKVSVGTQTVSFSEVIDLLAEKEAEFKDLKIMLEEKKFVAENIKDDTKMKALTSFTWERFFDFF
ncbi:hypothetical protein NPIL_690921 [Nephila pilipes]|uniref:Uncharacterized protein n=1 Tax=Nephila pilipes TaxID=299642 RepID=A0A8X6P5W6_NEPPI|nr:hypothetical protein NPIL_690921 [Nephila pilipes]